MGHGLLLGPSTAAAAPALASARRRRDAGGRSDSAAASSAANSGSATDKVTSSRQAPLNSGAKLDMSTLAGAAGGAVAVSSQPKQASGWRGGGLSPTTTCSRRALLAMLALLVALPAAGCCDGCNDGDGDGVGARQRS